ncbi:hypothetical protein [uncultured Nocardioides sp.]|uniref:hypothetical protein n=1 Tax=uncultured Nocardioides sp. TaxID=198441 RepID=UPI00261325E2|nr:hypothetical protein [uncultured Nocardioides sp.]
MRTRITVEASDEIIVVRGYGARDLMRGAGMRPIFSGSAGGWMLDASKLPDLLAALEHRGVVAEVGERR